jgi:hypothetical protein
MTTNVTEILERSTFDRSASQLSHVLQCAMTEIVLSDQPDTKKLNVIREVYESISNRAVLLEKLQHESAQQEIE